MPPPEPASHEARAQLPGQERRDGTQPPDRHRLEGLELERTLGDEPLEAPDRHLVQAALDLPEPRRAVLPEPGPPADQRRLREDEMRPREHREKVTAQGMEPCGAEGEQHAALGLERAGHQPEYAALIVEVLEPIDRDHHVDRSRRAIRELAPIGDPRLSGGPPGPVERALHDVHADHVTSPSLEHLDRVAPLAAAEVHDVTALDLLPDLRSEQDLELAATVIGAAVAVPVRIRIAEAIQEAIGQRAAHQTGPHHARSRRASSPSR